MGGAAARLAQVRLLATALGQQAGRGRLHSAGGAANGNLNRVQFGNRNLMSSGPGKLWGEGPAIDLAPGPWFSNWTRYNRSYKPTNCIRAGGAAAVAFLARYALGCILRWISS